MALLAIAALLAQVPQGVQDTGLELIKQGGFAGMFAIASAVAIVEAIAIVYLFKDSRKYERDTNAKTFEITGGLGQALKDSAQATKETNTTLATLAAEVRARGP